MNVVFHVSIGCHLFKLLNYNNLTTLQKSFESNLFTYAGHTDGNLLDDAYSNALRLFHVSVFIGCHFFKKLLDDTNLTVLQKTFESDFFNKNELYGSSSRMLITKIVRAIRTHDNPFHDTGCAESFRQLQK